MAEHSAHLAGEEKITARIKAMVDQTFGGYRSEPPAVRTATPIRIPQSEIRNAAHPSACHPVTSK